MPQHQMTIAEIFLNPSVPAEDEIRLSKQAHAIYKMLLSGKVSTSDMAQVARQYNARIWEIRQYVEQFGQIVKMTKGDGGNNLYEIVDKGD